MQAHTETAFAKINLALHVRRRRDDGYHDIETFFGFVDDGDRLTAAPSSGTSLELRGPFGGQLSAHDNLVLEAAQALNSYCGTKHGARLLLEKRLPVASGIGGGSADAAATLRLLNGLWETGLTDEELAEIAAPLGADIPACIYSTMMYGAGKGTELQSVEHDAMTSMPVLLVNPGIGVSTAGVFQRWDGRDRGELLPCLSRENLLNARNDLEPPAIALCPAIAEVMAELERSNAWLVRMSGSGATCFALFAGEGRRDEARQQIGEKWPEWWTLAGKLR